MSKSPITARSFEEVWAISRTIPGHFNESEARYMFVLACTIAVDSPHRAVFVEIGSLCGRSSTVLAAVAADYHCDLTCVDFYPDTDATLPAKGPQPSQAMTKILANMKAVGARFTLMMMPSDEAAAIFDRPIDLLFVDGSHPYKDVCLDRDLWVPKLRSSGWVLFHDYAWSKFSPQVRRAVDALAGYQDYGLVVSTKVLKKQ